VIVHSGADHGRRDWIVPEGLWEIVRSLLPAPNKRLQGGGTANIDDEVVFAAIVYVLTSGAHPVGCGRLPIGVGGSAGTVGGSNAPSAG
jgi:hypothetical protein